MGALRGLPTLQSVDHRTGLRQKGLQDAVRLFDDELLDLLVRLELVQEADLLERQAHALGQVKVDVRLLDVAQERALQVLIELVQVVDPGTVRRLHVVLLELVGRVNSHRAKSYRLDLDHIAVCQNFRCKAMCDHGPVLVAPDQ